MPSFPRTQVEGVSLPRMLMGSNWILGYSHTTVSADEMIRRRYSEAKASAEMVKAYLEYDIDAMMAPFGGQQALLDGIKMAEDETGKKVIKIDTPIINVNDSAAARAEAKAKIEECAKNGAKICLIHHSSAEQLVNKNKGTIERLPDYTDMIRQAGMIPGLSAHMPELILYSDENGYDVETYIQLYNCMGFLMQVEVETVASIIHNAKKPVMTIKPMAAGRVSPFVGLNFVWNTIRDCDMVTIGCTDAEEAAEDIEISLAAIERRLPGMGKRSSPNVKQDAFGGGVK